MNPLWRILALSTCLAACVVDDPLDPRPSSGSAGTGTTISSAGATGVSTVSTGLTGDSDTGDLSSDDGLDLSGCDLLADPLDTCGHDLACDPETLACVPTSGVGIVDEPCTATSECTPALVCFDGRCRELCGPDIPGEDECDGDRVCTLADAPLPGLCLEPCLLLAQVCSVVGDACNLAVGSGDALVSACSSNPGAGVDGDQCEIDGDCLSGYLCTPANLHTLPCAGGALSCCTPSCDVFELPCFGLEPICNLLGIEDQPGAGFCGP